MPCIGGMICFVTVVSVTMHMGCCLGAMLPILLAGWYECATLAFGLSGSSTTYAW